MSDNEYHSGSGSEAEVKTKIISIFYLNLNNMYFK